ncbi:MAG: flagellar basal body-associated protein FliL [Hahellaceae bacterium]|nr:flagellar basal body-associated protein FliL [Hahellaceae bacterium]MCP5210138.1 flagellar basal body-associated protein FliL [Hahellaceae bacterium]
MMTKHFFYVIAVLFAAVFSPGVASEEEAVTFKTQYIEMKPAFVTNYGTPGKKKLKYVKADISLRVTSKDAADAVEAHMPYLRNEVVLLLSSQSESTMSDPIGQDTVRKLALEAVNKVLSVEAGKGVEVDDLLFTNFVVQR